VADATDSEPVPRQLRRKCHHILSQLTGLGIFRASSILLLMDYFRVLIIDKCGRVLVSAECSAVYMALKNQAHAERAKLPAI